MAVARMAISRVDRRAPLDANALAAASFVRNWIRYCHEWPEYVAGMERLATLRAGDCDDMVTCLAALLIRLGYRPGSLRWVIGWRRGRPVHVWLSVRGKATGQWHPLDPSTWRVEPGQSPAPYGRFGRITRHRLEV